MSEVAFLPASIVDAPTLAGLVRLLRDVVGAGASVGFLAPLDAQHARTYWEGVAADPAVLLWIATVDGEVAGSIQLAPCFKPNGRHRADLQKLIVGPAFRGRGLARKLLDAVEREAQARGISLLVLDTEEDSDAEHIYPHLGWTRVGRIPEYATQPDGTLIATVYFYKLLPTRTSKDHVGA
ncbi:MAG: GNAT family N-acetyltransferase [Myxococcota bacterium]